MKNKDDLTRRLKRLIDKTNRAACMGNMLEFLDAAAALADQTIADEAPDPLHVAAMNVLGSVILNAYPGNFPIAVEQITTLASLAKAVEARGDSAGDSLFVFLLAELETALREPGEAGNLHGISPYDVMRLLRTVEDDVRAVRGAVGDYFDEHGIPYLSDQ